MTPAPRPALVAALAAAALAAGAAQAAPGYTVVKRVALGAPDRWDYVTFDPATRRVYVAHGDRLSVVDGRDGTVIGEMIGMPGGAHGIGLVAGKGYTDDGKAGAVVVFDPKTLKVIGRIPVKPDADGIAVDPVSGHVFVVDGDSGTVSVIDPQTDKVVATIDAGGGLEFGVAGGDGKLYVNGAQMKEIVRIDTRANVIDARWPIPGCASPHGLAFDPAAHRLFASCVNKVLTVVDTTNGSVVATLPIGRGADAAAFDPVRKRAFSANGEGSLTVIAEQGPNTFAVTETVPTQPTGRTLGIDPASGRLYIPAAEIDAAATAAAGAGRRPAKPKLAPGSLTLLFLDPVK